MYLKRSPTPIRYINKNANFCKIILLTIILTYFILNMVMSSIELLIQQFDQLIRQVNTSVKTKNVIKYLSFI